MIRFGTRRLIEIEGIEYGIAQLPCSDSIEKEHPEGVNYLVYSFNKEYTVLKHFKTFPDAELFLISKVKQAHNKDVVRIDLTKHKLIDGEIYIKNIKVSSLK